VPQTTESGHWEAPRAWERLSNSRSAFKISTRGAFDTVALNYAGEGGSELMSAVLASPDQVRHARGLLVTTPHPSGARVLAWPDYGVVKVEGRLGALVAGDRRCYELGHRADLLDGEAAAERVLADLFARAPTVTPRLSRYDLVSEVEPHRDIGFGLIRSMRPLCPPRYKVNAYDYPGTPIIESVRYVTAKRGAVVFRVYDKISEMIAKGHLPASRRSEAGGLVRFEAQTLHRGSKRRPVEVVANSDLRADYARTLTPVLQAAKEVVVTHPNRLAEQLAGKAARGELTPAKAASLLGASELLRLYGRAFFGNDARSAYWLRELRAAGVHVDDELPREAVVPVGELLRELVDGFRVA
jgi:hypothetical protein